MTDAFRVVDVRTAELVLRSMARTDPGMWVAEEPSPHTGSVRIHRVDDATP